MERMNDNKSALVQVMALCQPRTEKSHELVMAKFCDAI